MTGRPSKLCAYYRVSTARQGASGLGLEAQRAAVLAYAQAGSHVIVSEHVEVESGGKADRPQLAAALSACALHRATLVIAKLDRLARNVAFISNLMDAATRGGVDFVACDIPHANRLTLHLMAAMAEHEREMISLRTRAALAAAKARGVRLGNPRGAAALREGCGDGARKAATQRAAAAARRAATMRPILAQLASEGLVHPTEIALALNRRGVPAPGGGAWYPHQVRRTAHRLSCARSIVA